MRKFVVTSVALCAAVLFGADARAQGAGRPPLWRNPQHRDRRRRPRPPPSKNPRRTTGRCASRWSAPSGDLVYFERMDNCQFGSIGISQRKATAAAIFRRPTKVFEDRVASGPAGVGRHVARRRDRLRRRHSDRDRRQDRRRDRLQRRHRRAGRTGLHGRRQRGEVTGAASFDRDPAGARPGRSLLSAAHQLSASHLIDIDVTSPSDSSTQAHTNAEREIGDLKPPVRHREHAGDDRHRGAQRPGEARDENRRPRPIS